MIGFEFYLEDRLSRTETVFDTTADRYRRAAYRLLSAVYPCRKGLYEKVV